MLQKKNKIIIAGNGSISRSQNNDYYANIDVQNILFFLNECNYKPVYVANGSFKNIENPSGFNLNENGFKFIQLTGGKRNPLRYLKIGQLIFTLLNVRFVYIYYPGGISKIVAKLCDLFCISYGVYVRGYGLFQKGNRKYDIKEESFNDTWLLEKAKFLITVSPKMQEDLYEYNTQVEVIRPMINWNMDDIIRKPKNFFITNHYNLLFVGAPTERKGIYELLDIASHLDESGINYTIDVLGESKLVDSFREGQKNGSISNNINFQGGVYDNKEKATFFENAHGLLMLTRNEGFPRVLYEAMIKSVPVFTTMVSGISKTMIDGYNCVALPVGEPTEQADLIKENITKSLFLKEITLHGVETIKEVFDKREIHEKVLLNCLKG